MPEAILLGARPCSRGRSRAPGQCGPVGDHAVPHKDPEEDARVRHRVALETLRDVEADLRSGSLDDAGTRSNGPRPRRSPPRPRRRRAAQEAVPPAADQLGRRLAAGVAVVIGGVLRGWLIDRGHRHRERDRREPDPRGGRGRRGGAQDRITDPPRHLRADPRDVDTLSDLTDAISMGKSATTSSGPQKAPGRHRPGPGSDRRVRAAHERVPARRRRDERPGRAPRPTPTWVRPTRSRSLLRRAHRPAWGERSGPGLGGPVRPLPRARPPTTHAPPMIRALREEAQPGARPAGRSAPACAGAPEVLRAQPVQEVLVDTSRCVSEAPQPLVALLRGAAHWPRRSSSYTTRSTRPSATSRSTRRVAPERERRSASASSLIRAAARELRRAGTSTS